EGPDPLDRRRRGRDGPRVEPQSAGRTALRKRAGRRSRCHASLRRGRCARHGGRPCARLDALQALGADGVTDSVALPGESSELADRLRLRRWSDPAIVAIALIAVASGFGQYGAVAALGDVSKQLGHVTAGGSIADKVGLSGTSLGVGLAIIRLASLGSLPLIGIADRFGRRRVILIVTILGLGLTVVAAASPGYWWFVAIFAFGRPLLSATNALAEVMGAEETGSR